jgi:hypothetical protein
MNSYLSIKYTIIYMVQFGLYERPEIDGEINKQFHYIGIVNSYENLDDVFNTHVEKTDGKLRFVPLKDNENIPYNFSDEDDLNSKCDNNEDLISELNFAF